MTYAKYVEALLPRKLDWEAHGKHRRDFSGAALVQSACYLIVDGAQTSRAFRQLQTTALGGNLGKLRGPVRIIVTWGGRAED